MAEPQGKVEPIRRSQWRADDLLNAFTKMGLTGADKRLATEFRADLVSQEQLEQWYRGSDLAATIVELVPEEMFRRGFELSLGDKTKSKQSDVVKDTFALLEERLFLEKLQQALEYARAYGGAGILLGADDGKELDAPLLEEDSSVESFQWMTVLSPRELRPAKDGFYSDVRSPRYGEVEFYEVVPDQLVNGVRPPPIRVHESRLLRFDGIRVSRRQRQSNEAAGWGDSVLVRCYPIVRDYTSSWQGAATLLQHFSQAYLKMAKLAEMMEDDESTQALVNRATGVQLSRSIANMLVLDESDEVGTLNTPLSGYPEMLQQFAIRLAAAARIPVTLLMGQAPAGLNATGESDVRHFYDRVASLQHKVLRPALNRVLQLLFRSKDGPTGGKEPDLWEVQFRPLWQLSDLEQADLMAKVASADNQYLANGVLTPEEVAISRFGSGRFSMDTSIDLEGRKAVAAVGYEEQSRASAAQEELAAGARAAAE